MNRREKVIMRMNDAQRLVMLLEIARLNLREAPMGKDQFARLIIDHWPLDMSMMLKEDLSK